MKTKISNDRLEKISEVNARLMEKLLKELKAIDKERISLRFAR